MKDCKCKKVRLYNRRGVELIEDSIEQAAKDLGISRTTLRSRSRDGYCVHLPNGATGIYIQILEPEGRQHGRKCFVEKTSYGQQDIEGH